MVDTTFSTLPALNPLSLLGEPPEAVYAGLIRLASRLFHTPAALVLVGDAQGQHVASSVGLTDPEGSFPEARLSALLAPLLPGTGHPLVITDAFTDVRVAELQGLRDLGIQALLGISLKLAGGSRAVTLILVDTRTRDWTVDSAEALQELARPYLNESNLCNTAVQAGVRAELGTARERRFRALIENSTDLVALLSADGTFLYQSPSFQHVLGYAPADLAEVTAFSLIHPEDLPGVRDSFLRKLGRVDESPVVLPLFRCRARDGSWHWLESTAATLQHDPLVQGIVVNLRDVSERMTVEAALQDSEARYRRIVETASEGVWMADPAGHTTFVNPQLARMLGYAPEEMLGRRLQEFLPEAEHALLRERRLRRQQGVTEQYDARCFHRDGSEVWLLVSATPIYGADGAYQGSLALVTDITERKRVEAALQDSETRFRAIFAEAGIGIALLDRNGDLLECNRTLLQWLRYPREALLGRPVRELSPPEDLAEDERLFGELQAGTRDRYQLEKRYVRQDGGDLWGRLTVTSVRDGEGDLRFAIGMVEGITEQKREAERRQVFQMLGQRLNACRTPEDAARTVLAAADQLLGWDSCWLELVDPEQETGTFVVAMDEINGVRTPLKTSGEAIPLGLFTRQLIIEGPLLILRSPEDVARARNEGTCPFGDRSRYSASLLCVPIWSEGRIIGAISVQSYQFDAYEPWDPETLQALADYCAGALQRTQAEAARQALQEQLAQAQQAEAQALREQARLASLREEIGSALGADLDVPAALGEALQSLVQRLPIAFARVWTLDDTRQFLRMRASAGLYSEVSGPRQQLRVGDTEIGRLVSEGQPQLNNEVQDDPLHTEWALAAGIQGFAGYPLLVDGEPVGALAVFSHEPITPGVFEALGVVAERLARYLDRIRAHQALQEMQTRFSAFMEHLPAMATMRDEEGRYVYVNRQFERTYGVKLDEVKGLPLEALFPPATAAEFEANTQEVLRLNQPQEFIETVTTPDGRLREFLAVKFPIRDPQGRPYVGVICTDLTERRGLEAQLRQAQKMEAVGRLAGGVAHDFNNMLGVINGYAELLAARADLPSDCKDYLGEVLQAGQRAASLTRQLLAFSRQELIQPRDLHLDELVLNFQKMLRRLIGEDIELVTRIEPDLGVVRADPGQLEQVLMNLAVNARDAMPQGGTLTLALDMVCRTRQRTLDGEQVAAGEYVCLAATDGGKGIDVEVLPHIFEPFYTTKGVGQGTGLGLATVYGIVKQNRGHIEVESEAGQGTTFRVYLPRLNQPRPHAGAERLPEAPSGRETILVVEDEEMLGGLLCTVLRASGYEVLRAGTADEAFRICQEHAGEIDLLLTDVVMPGRSGRELAVFAGARYPLMKVIYMSGYTDDAVIRHGVSAAQVHFMQKPFAPAALAEKVREVLDQ